MNWIDSMDPHEQLDDELAALAVSWDSALASGVSPTWPFADDSSAVSPRHERILDCLKRLERAWPRANEKTTLPRKLGRFSILHELGRGAHGVVMLAHDPLLNRDVALKIPHPEALVTEELRQRFHREGHAASALDHPNIVTIHEAGQEGAVCYIASAFCPGTDLATWLGGRDDLVSQDMAARFVAALADGVDHAHRRGVVHRDIKPANILMVPEDGEEAPQTQPVSWSPKLTDFGLARLLHDEQRETKTGAVLGTSSYMAPEQAQGRTHEADCATDVYGLGATLYELLTGRPPFKAATFVETLRQVVACPPVEPRRLSPSLSRDLETICLKCLEKSPEKRYRSAKALADDLRRFLQGESIEARPVSRREKLLRWIRQHPGVALLQALVAIAVVSLLVGAAVHYVKLRNLNVMLFESAVRERNANAEAQVHRANAAAEAWLSRRHLYVLQMRAVQQALKQEQPTRAIKLLNAARPRTDQPDVRGLEWRQLWRMSATQAFGLKGAVYRCAISPNGRLVATAGQAEYICIWDRSTKRILAKLHGHRLTPPNDYAAVRWIAFSPDSKLLASGGSDGTARVWDVESASEVGVLRGHEGRLTGLAFSPDGRTIASCGNDDTIRLWRWESGEHTTLRGHRENVHHVAFAPDGSVLASCSWDKTIKTWDVSTGKELNTLLGHKKAVNCLAFSPDGERLASASFDKTARIWDWRKGEVTRTLAGHKERVRAVAFARDGDVLISVDGNAVVKYWNEAGEEVASVESVLRGGNTIAITPDGRYAFIAGERDFVAVQDISEVVDTPSRHGSRAWSVAFSPDGQTIASGGDDAAIVLWDGDGEERCERWALGLGPIHRIAISPNGQTLVGATEAGSAAVYDLSSRKPRTMLLGHWSRIDGLAFSPCGREIATTSWDKTAKIWNVESGNARLTLRGHTDVVRATAYAPHGKLLATGSDDHSIQIWRTETGQLEKTLRDDYRVRALAFLGDGETLASGNARGSVKLWDVASGEIRTSLGSHAKGVRCLALAPDGYSFATGSVDGTVKFWDLVTEQEIVTLDLKHEVTGVAYSPDGRRLAVTRLLRPRSSARRSGLASSS